MPEVVLIVDDDPVQRRLLESMIQRFGYQVMVAEGGDAAIRALVGPEASRIDGVVLDLVMPDLDGLGVLARMREAGLTIPVIVQTAHGGIDTVVSAMRAGATDFVVKPAGAERLQVSLHNALATKALAGELQRLKRKHDDTLTIADVITRSVAMQPVLRAAEKAAASVIPVLIEGESGVGKEMIARAIHGSGPRRAKPFVAVNCGAMPENLVESILFGHEKGAFTGALARRIGKFEEAKGGTLLLDEISEMDVRLQAKLLRAIQERVIDRVGGNRPVPVDIRIIATSNRNLTEAVREGRFREDLMFRLNLVNLKIPPLHERPSDIGELAEYFTKKYSRANGLPLRPLSTEARRALNINRWPGNVRELENTLHRAVLLSSGAEIGVDGILSPDGARLDQARGTDLAAHAVMAAEQITRNLVGRTVAEVERDLILETLKHCLGNRTRAANILGISIRTLRNKLNEYAADGSPIPPPHGSSALKGAA